MTVKDVLKMYSIKMENLIMTPNGPGSKYIRKTFSGGNKMQFYFDLSDKDSKWLTEEILPIVQHFIDGNVPPMSDELSELGGMVTFAIPYLEGICFYNPNNGEIEQTVPLEHFKMIAEAWRDFLSQPPLSGTKV